MKALRLVSTLTLALLVAGCADPVARNYLANRPATPLGSAAGDVVVREVSEVGREEQRLQREGWERVGHSDFSEVTPLRIDQVRDQARRVGAELAIWQQSSKSRRADDIKVTHYVPQSDSFERTSSSTEPPTRPIVANVPGAQFREYFCHVSFWRRKVVSKLSRTKK